MTISCNNLSFFSSNISLFKNLSFSLLPGCIVHVIGANGSGKTSLLKMIAGIIPTANESKILIDGCNIVDLEDKRPYINYIGHDLGLNNQLTVFDNIRFWSEVYSSAQLIDAAINYLELGDILELKCSKLSAGMQKRVSIARLLACNSKIWLLDELDSNLDFKTKMILANIINIKKNSGGVIIFTSHSEKLYISDYIKINLEDFA